MSIRRERGRALILLPATLCAAIWLAACGRDAHLADHDVRDVTVGPITAYGRTLDASAAPVDVVFVLLKAVVDDYDAGGDREARERAFEIELKTSAPSRIKDAVMGDRQMSELRLREGFYSAVRHWAPILGFYVDDFRADYAALAERMYVVVHSGRGPAPDEADVYLNVAHPGPAQNSGGGVVACFRLVKESGYWRIWSVGWDHSTRNWKLKPPSGVKIPPQVTSSDTHKPTAPAATRPAKTG